MFLLTATRWCFLPASLIMLGLMVVIGRRQVIGGPMFLFADARRRLVLTILIMMGREGVHREQQVIAGLMFCFAIDRRRLVIASEVFHTTQRSFCQARQPFHLYTAVASQQAKAKLENHSRIHVHFYERLLGKLPLRSTLSLTNNPFNPLSLSVQPGFQ